MKNNFRKYKSSLLIFLLGVICAFFPSIASLFEIPYLDMDIIIEQNYTLSAGIILIILSIGMFIWAIYTSKQFCIIEIKGLNNIKLSKPKIKTFSKKTHHIYELSFTKMNKSELMENVQKIKTLFDNNKNNNDSDNNLNYCFTGICYTPFVFYLGTLYNNGDKKYSFFHYFRNNGNKLKELSKKEKKKNLLIESYLENNHSKDLIVTVETTFEINDFDSIFSGMDILKFSAEYKGYDVVNNYETLYKWCDQIIDRIHNLKDKYENIHLLLSSSNVLCFLLGTKLNNNYDPIIYVYHYDKNNSIKYPWALCPKDKNGKIVKITSKKKTKLKMNV